MKIRNRFFLGTTLLAALVLSVGEVLAQEAAGEGASEPLITDRPDFTESPQTVARGRVQLEGGFTYTNSGGARQSDFGELLVRAGLNDKTELRIGVPTYSRVSGGGSGFGDLFLGTKFALSPGSGEIGLKKPAVGLLVGTTLPTGSNQFRAKYQPEVVLALGFDLSERVALGTNLGVAYNDDGQRFTSLFGSLALGLALTDRTGAYAEIYGFNKADSAGNSARYVNTGLTYLLNNDLQLDARVGTGLSNNIPGSDYFFGVGASQRF